MIEARGLESPTPASRTQCSSRLSCSLTEAGPSRLTGGRTSMLEASIAGDCGAREFRGRFTRLLGHHPSTIAAPYFEQDRPQPLLSRLSLRPRPDQPYPHRRMEQAHQGIHRRHPPERRPSRRRAQQGGGIRALDQADQCHQREARAGCKREPARPVHAFTAASGSRNAASPASDIATHLGSGLVSAS